MRRVLLWGLAASILLCLGAASGAHGATVRHRIAAGPAFMGDSIVWGEEHRDGTSSVMRWSPGAAVEAIHRIPAPRGRNRERGFGGVPGALTASAQRLAFGLYDDVVTHHGDSVEYNGDAAAIGAPPGGALTPLVPGCTGGYVETDIDAESVLVGEPFARCAGDRAATDRVWLIDGPGPARLVHESR